MKKKTLYILFTALFIGICLVPAVGMLVFGESEAAANEILAGRPSLTDPEGRFNEDFTREATDYIADRFAGRQEAITAYAKLQAFLFRESASPKVVLGKEGWLFFADTLDDYLHRDTLSDREIFGIGRTLEMMQEYAEAQGADFVFTVAPNKNSLAANAVYMPRVGEAFEEAKNLDKLEEALKRYDVNYVPLRETLDEAGLYHRLDSHWNRLGAAKAFGKVMERLHREAVDWSGEPFQVTKDHPGDLYEMLYPAGKELDDNMMFDRAFRFRYLSSQEMEPFVSPAEGLSAYGSEEAPPVDKQLLETVCSEGRGTLLMFRDSFGNALHPFFGDAFERAAFSRQMPYRLDWLGSGGADVLAVEIVERNLADLSEMAPIMPAPAADPGIDPVEDPEREVTIQMEPCMEMPGFVKITGIFGPEGVRADTRIYVNTESDLYEAFPAGAGETERDYGRFTAYLPEESVQNGVLSVIIEGERDWLTCTNLNVN